MFADCYILSERIIIQIKKLGLGRVNFAEKEIDSILFLS